MNASSGFPIERVVTLVAPFFAALASVFTGWLASKTGVHIDSAELGGLMASAFLGTIAIVFKWLHGRQIPAIAGLQLTPEQIDHMHSEIQSYLAAHGPELKADESQVGEAVEGYLSSHVPAAFKPDVDTIVQAVLARLASLSPPSTGGSPAS